MRTTLTIDDDLAGILQKRAGQEGQSFKEVVNRVLRAGIATTGEAPVPRQRVQVVGRPLGLKSGYDPDKLNQLTDEIEAGYFSAKAPRS